MKPSRKLRACGRCVVTSIWLPANTIPAGRIVTSSVPSTKGQFALHSQTVQMVCHQFLANVDTARELRKTNRKIRYPYKDKRFYPLFWPAQAVSVERGRIVLPMGRGRASLVFKLDLPEHIGGCKLVWKDGYELHVSVPAAPAPAAPGAVQATVDLGEIHQAAVTTNTGAALVVSGRGIRSLKRRHQMALGQLARKRKRCTPGSRRWRKLQRARRQVSARKRRQIRDAAPPGHPQGDHLLPAAARGRLFIGNPHGVRKRNSGRHHNQRMAVWEYGQDIAYLSYKATEPAPGASLVLSGEQAASGRYAAGNRKYGAPVALPQPRVFVPRASGGGRQRQHAPTGLWDEDCFPRSHHVSTSRPRKGLGQRDKHPCQVQCSPPVVGARTRAARSA